MQIDDLLSTLPNLRAPGLHKGGGPSERGFGDIHEKQYIYIEHPARPAPSVPPRPPPGSTDAKSEGASCQKVTEKGSSDFEAETPRGLPKTIAEGKFLARIQKAPKSVYTKHLVTCPVTPGRPQRGPNGVKMDPLGELKNLLFRRSVFRGGGLTWQTCTHSEHFLPPKIKKTSKCDISKKQKKHCFPKPQNCSNAYIQSTWAIFGRPRKRSKKVLIFVKKDIFDVSRKSPKPLYT